MGLKAYTVTERQMLADRVIERTQAWRKKIAREKAQKARQEGKMSPKARKVREILEGSGLASAARLMAEVSSVLLGEAVELRGVLRGEYPPVGVALSSTEAESQRGRRRVLLVLEPESALGTWVIEPTGSCEYINTPTQRVGLAAGPIRVAFERFSRTSCRKIERALDMADAHDGKGA